MATDLSYNTGMRQTMTHRLKRFLILAVATTALLISGCTSGAYWTWQHPQGLDDVALQQAQNECQAMAERELNKFDYYRPYDFYPWNYKRYSRTGHYRPYYVAPRYDFQRYNFDLNQLYRFCLQAKGWQRVIIEPQQKQNPE